MSKKIEKFLKNTEKKLNHLDRVIRSVKANCNKFYIVIRFDMFISYLLYFVNIDEYKVLEFYKMNHTMRKTFLNEIKHNFYNRFLYKKDGNYLKSSNLNALLCNKNLKDDECIYLLPCDGLANAIETNNEKEINKIKETKI